MSDILNSLEKYLSLNDCDIEKKTIKKSFANYF